MKTKHHCICCGGDLKYDGAFISTEIRRFDCVTCIAKHYITQDDLIYQVLDAAGVRHTEDDLAAKKKYKVWLHVEELELHGDDGSGNCREPVELFCSTDRHEAEQMANSIERAVFKGEVY